MCVTLGMCHAEGVLFGGCSVWSVESVPCMFIQCRSKVVHPIIACTRVHARVHVRVSGNCC